ALAPPELYTLSLHDALPILRVPGGGFPGARGSVGAWVVGGVKGQMLRAAHAVAGEGPAEGGPSKAGQLVAVKLTVGRRRAETVRSEEHTSELQSRGQLVCRL